MYSAHLKVDTIFVIENLTKPEEGAFRISIPMGWSVKGAYHIYKKGNDTPSSQIDSPPHVKSMTGTQALDLLPFSKDTQREQK